MAFLNLNRNRNYDVYSCTVINNWCYIDIQPKNIFRWISKNAIWLSDEKVKLFPFSRWFEFICYKCISSIEFLLHFESASNTQSWISFFSQAFTCRTTIPGHFFCMTLLKWDKKNEKKIVIESKTVTVIRGNRPNCIECVGKCCSKRYKLG